MSRFVKNAFYYVNAILTIGYNPTLLWGVDLPWRAAAWIAHMEPRATPGAW